MRSWVLLFVLLTSACSRGATAEGPTNESSLLEYETTGLKSAAIGETTGANISFITKEIGATAQKFQEFSKGDEDNRFSSLPEWDNNLRLTMELIPKLTADDGANEKDVDLQPHDGVESFLQIEEIKQPLLAKGEAPLAGTEETKTKGENNIIYKDPLEDEDEEEGGDDDDEKTMKPLSIGEQSLVNDEEMVNPQTQELELMSSPSQAVQKELEIGNASNIFMEPKIYQQKETTVQENELDEDIVSVHQLQNENKPQDEKYTMFVYEEKNDDATSELQEEDDNTWFIFEEDEDDDVDDVEDAASESQEESDEDLWFTFDDDDDDYRPSLQRNSTVLTAEPIYGDQSFLENADDNVVSDPDEGYGALSDHAVDNMNRVDGVENFSDHEIQNQNSPKEEYLSSYFYVYLVATAAVVIVLYAVYHNNRKIIAFVLRRCCGGGWSASEANYHSLHNKV